MRRALMVLMGMWIPLLAWAECPSMDIAKIALRDVSQGAIPDSYITEANARHYRMMKYYDLKEIQEPGHSMPELLIAYLPDMGKIIYKAETDTDITHRRDPWDPRVAVMLEPDWSSPGFYGDLTCVQERFLWPPETMPTMSLAESLLEYSSYEDSCHLYDHIQANAAEPFAVCPLERDTWEICACSLVRGYDSPTDLSLCQRLEGDFCGY